MIYEFDSKERLDNIKILYSEIKELNNSLAYKRSKYRKFSKIIKIDYYILERSIKNLQCSLLIECYTFMEQLIKNFYYHFLEKNRHSNKYLNIFLDKKLPEDKFSPNIRYHNIQKILKDDLGIDSLFFIKLNKNLIDKYDDLVKTRHRYAHNGNYDYEFENYEDIIKILEFLRFNIHMYTHNKKKYEEIKIIIAKIKDDVKKIQSCENPSKKYFSEKIKELRKSIKKFNNLIIKTGMNKIFIFKELIEKIDMINNVDLRNKNIVEIINKIKLEY